MKDGDTLYEFAETILEVAKRSVSSLTLARVTSIETPFDYNTGYGRCYVTPFPLYGNEEPYQIIAYYFSDISFREKEIVSVGFTDYSFADNLASGSVEPLPTSNKNIHSRAFGVILNPTYRARILAEEPGPDIPGYEGDVVFVVHEEV